MNGNNHIITDPPGEQAKPEYLDSGEQGGALHGHASRDCSEKDWQAILGVATGSSLRCLRYANGR